jgi:sulfur carrier protein ThiS
MEYPFIKCPKKSTDTPEPNPFVQLAPGNPPEREEHVPQIVAQLIRQAVKVEEESMTLLDLLVKFIEQNPKITVKSNESPYPAHFISKNRLYK